MRRTAPPRSRRGPEGSPLRVSDGPLAWAAKDPARVAICCGPAERTFAELATDVRGLSERLLDDHPGLPGNPVCLEAEDGLAFLTGFLALAHVGAVVAPLARAWTVPQCAQAEHTVGAVAVLRHAGGAFDLERLRDAGPRTWPGPESGHPFYIGFTSGSTGAPKPIPRAHRAWLNSFLAMSLEFDIEPRTRMVVPGDLFFSFGLIAALHALFVGASVVLDDTSRLRIPDLANAMETPDATVLYAVPSVLGELVRWLQRRNRTLPNLARYITAGEKLHPATRHAAAATLPNAHGFEYYGASEIGFVTVLGDDDFRHRPGSVGRPFAGAAIAVLDEAGDAVPPGAVGLLCARTEFGSMRTWDASLSSWAVRDDGWQTAGDLAFQDDDGFVTLVGRRDNMLVLRGENVYPEEVERVVESLPGVARALALPAPASAPSHLVVLVVLDNGSALETRAILLHCRESLAGVKVPRRAVFVPSLPTTATGKVDRDAARALLD